MLEVKGFKGVHESLAKFFESETFDGGDKLDCEYC
jgi:hypothetical protein